MVPGVVAAHSDNVLIKVTSGPSNEKKNADTATCSVLVLVDLSRSLLLAVK